MVHQSEEERFRRNMARGEEGREEDAVFIDPDRCEGGKGVGEGVAIVLKSVWRGCVSWKRCA